MQPGKIAVSPEGWRLQFWVSRRWTCSTGWATSFESWTSSASCWSGVVSFCHRKWTGLSFEIQLRPLIFCLSWCINEITLATEFAEPIFVGMPQALLDILENNRAGLHRVGTQEFETVEYLLKDIPDEIGFALPPRSTTFWLTSCLVLYFCYYQDSRLGNLT